MKLRKEIFKYIERELYDLEDTKKSIYELRQDITEIGSTNYDNEVHGTDITSATENKAIKLCTNKVLNRMVNVVYGISKAINRLDDECKQLYDLRYRKQIHHYKIITCHIPMSESTYFRKRDKIIETVAEELGLK